MNAIPLIQTVDKDSINTSLIALKKASEELKALNDEVTKKLALVNSAIADLNLDTVGGSGKLIQSISQNEGQVSASAIDIATSVESGNTQPVTSGAVAQAISNTESSLQPVDTVANGNMQSVTSNAVWWANFYKNTLYISDTRNENYPPSHYLDINGHHTHQEFKLCSAIGNPFNTQFCTLITIAPWADYSGGYPTQFAIDTFGSGSIMYRNILGDGTWGSWNKLANQFDLNTKLDMRIIDGIVTYNDFENALNANDPRFPDGFHGVWLRSGSWAVALYLKTMSPLAYCGYIWWTYSGTFVARWNSSGGPFSNMNFNA